MKDFIKLVARAVSRILVLPIYFLFVICRSFRSDREVFPEYSELFALIPGIIGIYLRREFYSLTLNSCSSDAQIGFGTVFSTTDVDIASGVYIGRYCLIGSASIGENTMLGSRVSVISGTKQHGISEDTDYQNQPGEFLKIVIARNVWLGEGAVVAAGVGENSRVAAGAVVLKNVAADSSVVGNPGRVV